MMYWCWQRHPEWVKVAVPTSGILTLDGGQAFNSVQEECATITPIPALGGDIRPHCHTFPALREMLSWGKLRFVCGEEKRWDLALWGKLRASWCP